MEIGTVLNAIPLIISQPGGLASIRRTILHLATSGALIEADPGLGDVDKEIAEAREARTSYARRLGIALAQITPIDSTRVQSGAIPRHWRWARLGELACYVQRGRTPRYSDAGLVKVVSQKCVQWDGLIMSHAKYIAQASVPRYSEERYLLQGDVLVNSTGTGTVGRTVVVGDRWDERAVVDSHVTIVRLSNYDPGYVRCVLASPGIQARMDRARPDSLVSGTTNQVELSTTSLRRLLVPCPPVHEQRQIVRRVNQLITICRRIEDAFESSRSLKSSIRTALATQLMTADTANSLLRTWQRLERFFSSLIDESNVTVDIESIVIDLASSGRLSFAQPSDGSPTEVIQSAIVGRQALVSAERTRPRKQAPVRIVGELRRPPHWASAELEEMFRFIDYRGRTPVKTPTGRILVTAKNVRMGFLADTPKEYIGETAYHEWMTRGFPRTGDILITTEAPLGNVARVTGDPDFALAQRVIDLQPYGDLNSEFFLYLFMSTGFQDLLAANSTGTTARGIKSAKLKRIQVGIPSLNEQTRIAITTTEILSLVRGLHGKLREREAISARLVRSLERSITGIDLEEPMTPQVPRVELIATLRATSTNDPRESGPLHRILVQNGGELSTSMLWSVSQMSIEEFYLALRTEWLAGNIVEPQRPYMRENAEA